MHPLREELELYVNAALTDSELKLNIKSHLEQCAFCREYCEEYQDFILTIPMDGLEIATAKLEVIASGGGFTGRVIRLIPLHVHPVDEDIFLAADGITDKVSTTECIHMVYSEIADVVMRIIRDNMESKTYIQIIADDERLCANVLIETREPDCWYVTDSSGYARINDDLPKNYDQLQWQIKLPGSMVKLQPFTYDSEKVESSSESFLKSDRGDEILVRYERLMEGQKITIQVLAIDGQKDYPVTHIGVFFDDGVVSCTVSPGREIEIDDNNTANEIQLRIY